MTLFYTYIHTFANGTKYVGKGSNGRAYQTAPGRHNVYWDRLAKKYGTPEVEIVAGCMSEQNALSLEMKVVAYFRAQGTELCNRTDGGDGCRGLEVSESTRKKMSENNSGVNNNMYGKTHSDEAKQSISELNTGRFVGRKSGRYKTDKFEFVNDKEGLKEHCTQYKLCAKYDLSQSHVSQVVSGVSASCKGWRLVTTPAEDAGQLKGKKHNRHDPRIFRFVNRDGRTEECCKYDFRIKYPDTHAGNLSSLCSGKLKSYKGWTVVKS